MSTELSPELAAELGLSDWYDPAELCANPKAAELMEQCRITSLLVVDEAGGHV